MEDVITRHRHELKRRALTVREKSNITPSMLRIVFEGEDLEDFPSLAPDDHVKLFITLPDGEVARRDYTPRYFDKEARRLAIDFALHDAGPATRWVLDAEPGDVLEVGGPRGSAVVAPIFDWWLLIGDETALPAIGRRIEELSAGDNVISLGLVTSPQDEQTFRTPAQHQAIWVHRPSEVLADPAPLLSALEGLDLPEGNGFVWIAAETTVARAARDHFLNARGHPRHWMKAAGYWAMGTADAHENLVR